MRFTALAVCACIFFSLPASGQKTEERLNDAVELVSDMMATPDRSIPQDLLEKAHCIVLVPGVKRAAFGFGGKFGRGFVTCRKPDGPGWSAPGAVRIEGGSFGFQIGVSSTDVILLVMNERGIKKLLSSKFTLGGDASVAAGPVGRSATAQTDASADGRDSLLVALARRFRRHLAGRRHAAQRPGREPGPLWGAPGQ
jgi:SH3 domain-containing YSC84-like protein 1